MAGKAQRERPNLLAATIAMTSDADGHSIELRFADRNEAERCLEWLENEAGDEE